MQNCGSMCPKARICICDPRQLPNLPTDLAASPLMFPNNMHAHLVDNGEWALHKASVVPGNGDFDIPQW